MYTDVPHMVQRQRVVVLQAFAAVLKDAKCAAGAKPLAAAPVASMSTSAPSVPKACVPLGRWAEHAVITSGDDTNNYSQD